VHAETDRSGLSGFAALLCGKALPFRQRTKTLTPLISGSHGTVFVPWALFEEERRLEHIERGFPQGAKSL